MVALLKNAIVAYSRSIYNASTGNTAAPTPFATIQAHVTPKAAMDFRALPNAALDSDIVVRCDDNTDIQEGDVITSIIVIQTGLNWPGTAPNANEILSVVFVSEGTPGLVELEYRDAFVKRARIGGATNA